MKYFIALLLSVSFVNGFLEQIIPNEVEQIIPKDIEQIIPKDLEQLIPSTSGGFPSMVNAVVESAGGILGNLGGVAVNNALDKLAQDLMGQLADAVKAGPTNEVGEGGCLDNQVSINKICRAKKTLGQSCPNGVQQCPSGSVCSFTCVCPTGTMANGRTQCIKCNANTNVLVSGVCYAKASFGGACTLREQCSFANGVCGATTKTCACATGSVWDGKACMPCGAGKVIVDNACLSMANYGAACQNSKQCVGYAGGACMSGKCACNVGLAWNKVNACAACAATEVLVSGQCLNKVPHGAACTANEQCSFTQGICSSGACACTGTLIFTGTQCTACDGVLQGKMCFPASAKGQSCAINAQCTKTPGTQCIGFTCDCPIGTVLTNGSCVKK